MLPARSPALTAALAVSLVTLACGDSQGAGSDAGMTEGTGSTGAAGSDPTSGPPDVPTTTGDDDDGGTGTMGQGQTTGETTGAPACDPTDLALVERDYLGVGEDVLGETLPACSEHRWYVAFPDESSWQIRLTRTGGAGPLRATVAYPDEPAALVWQTGLAPPLVSGEQPAEAIFAVPRSGEFAIHVRSDSPDQASDYNLEFVCSIGCGRETTRFPIVLVHGWTGFEAIGPITYFYNVFDELVGLGYPVEVAILDPYNSSTVRSGQLAEQVDEFLVAQRARKVDLLGHSQGGIDSRAVVATHGYGDRVSALVTIASPHRGTYITDLALGLAPGSVEAALGFLLNFVGAVSAQQKSDAEASFYSLSEHYMQDEFNPSNPDDPRVKYISYTGRTCDAAAFLIPGNHCNDLVDPLIGWGYALLQLARGDNDGLVTVDSAKWGEYRGEMIADHIDEVGQLLGVTDLDFDHLLFYTDLARDLAAEEH
ncbi:triacylglycerol lipase [Nannocystis sp. SCPEA4]|uniref:esterase/lipase family protein n=1 Tax=Nannocystis sp. SCPEA4 TaxID=2996787 RepID=UPI002270AF66|nr:triacylglycerol lipase [Nannocystis sp. SCPEA4]